MKHALFPLDELEPGQKRAVTLGATAIIVIRSTGGDVYALRNICPHRGPKLTRGTLTNAVTGDRHGEYRISTRATLRCPWHGFEFDAATGVCLGDPAMRVRTYPVEVVDGMVVIDR
jgi:nitrite reductase (NADH) small subunit